MFNALAHSLGRGSVFYDPARNFPRGCNFHEEKFVALVPRKERIGRIFPSIFLLKCPYQKVQKV